MPKRLARRRVVRMTNQSLSPPPERQTKGNSRRKVANRPKHPNQRDGIRGMLLRKQRLSIAAHMLVVPRLHQLIVYAA